MFHIDEFPEGHPLSVLQPPTSDATATSTSTSTAASTGTMNKTTRSTYSNKQSSIKDSPSDEPPEARVLSCILYLNPPDWDASLDGGCLRLYSYDSEGREQSHDVVPAGGSLVCFWSADVFHEVMAPVRRPRLSLTTWMVDTQPGRGRRGKPANEA